MRIAKLTIIIGDHEKTLTDCTEEDHDVAELMRMATSSSAVITIKVPQNAETAGALGRLVFNKPRTEQTHGTGSTDRISTLSKRLGEIGLLTRTVTALQNAGYIYVWQVAEKKEGEIRKHRDVGPKACNEIKVTFREMGGIELGTDLSSIKDQLP